MKDFTLKIYKSLLISLKESGYHFITFEEYIREYQTSDTPFIILRHDVDLLPHNSLQTAQMEHSLGIKGSYYFRIVPESFDKEIIEQIAQLGHEVGYHYETMDTSRGNVESAYVEFSNNLNIIRSLVPVSTICMHGSPRSKYDNRDIWEKYDYRKLDLIGEPYFDMDFNRFFYLTDTGRRWDGWRVSVRDRMPQQGQWVKKGLVYRSTHDIIKAAQAGTLPKQIMITVHPQRWTDNRRLWLKELILQRTKNIVKRFIVRRS